MPSYEDCCKESLENDNYNGRFVDVTREEDEESDNLRRRDEKEEKVIV